MSRKTTQNELYTQWVALIEQLTGRPTWRKGRMLTNPVGGYATIWMGEGPSPTQEVIEYVPRVVENELEPTLNQEVWGTTHLECVVAFHRDTTERAASAAVRFRNALQLEQRFFDIWQYCALSGDIRFVDISGIFREDIEPRAEIRFSIYANLTYDDPVVSPDQSIHQIDNVDLNIVVDEPQDFPIQKVINYTEE